MQPEPEVTRRFEAQRALAFSIAYRMLGSRAEAEDIVQEAWLRWQKSPHGELASDRAWLTRVVTRLCLDQLKSARARREAYVGPWLPEPLVAAPALPPGDPESISMAFLVLLESLSPLERAVFLLHRVFDYSHAEVSGLVGASEAACRQALHRAERQLKERRPRFASSRQAHQQLLGAFVQAVSHGDLAALEALCAEDVVFVADGGGRAQTARKVVRGRDAVTRGMLGGARRFWPETRVEHADVNGWPALLLWLGEQLAGVVSIECDDERIHAIHVVANPDKLPGGARA